MLTLREASEAVGMSKPGLLKAIRSGRVSAEKDIFGQWLIQPVELFRVYEPVPMVNGNGVNGTAVVNGADPHEVNAGLREEPLLPGEVNASYQVELDGLREKVILLERLIGEKDEVIRAKDALIEVVTADNNRLTAVVAQWSPPQARKGWWARLLGGA